MSIFLFFSRTCSEGNTALHYACMSASVCAVIILLSAGSDLHAINKHGESPLEVIPEKHQIKIGSLIRQAGDGLSLRNPTL